MAQGLYGLSGTGLDVDSIVEMAVQAKKTSYNSIYRKNQKLEWKREAYLSMYSKMDTYRNDVFNYKLQKNLVFKTVNVNTVGESGKTVLSATANSDAANVSHDVNVSQLAQSASISSKSAIGLKDDASKKLSTILGGSVSGGLSISISDDKEGKNAKTISYTEAELGSKTIYDFVSDINSSGLNLKATYDSDLDRLFIYNTQSGEDNQITLKANTVGGEESALGKKLIQNITDADAMKVGLGGDASQALTKLIGEENLANGLSLTVSNKDGTDTKTLSYTEDDLKNGKTFDDLIKDLNKLNIGALASYNKTTDRFEITYSDGTTAKIEAKNADGTESALGAALLEAAKYGQTDRSSATTTASEDGKSEFVAGQSAKLTIDGMEISQDSNTFTVAGVSYTLQDVGKARVQVNADTSAAIDSVTKFVESYNKMLEELKSARDETSYAYSTNSTQAYPPLTVEEKAEMSDDEIEKWEAKAKSGMLNNDPIIKTLINDMRYAATSADKSISGKYNSLASIGISTTSYLDGGKLTIDEDKLRAALEDDPDALSKLFSGDNGIAGRLANTLDKAKTSIKNTAGTPATQNNDTSSTIAKQLASYGDQMETMLERLEDFREQQYAKYNALEVAYANMSSQMSSLTSMMGTGG